VPLFVLFPIEGLEPINPLPAGPRRLPGQIDGVEQNWQVTSAGGTETFLVIGSLSPLVDLERELTKFASAGAHPEAGSAGALLLRGIGGMTPAQPAGDGGVLSTVASVLAQRQARGEPIRLDHWELQNPGEH